MKKGFLILLTALLIFLTGGCDSAKNRIIQTSTIDALLAGVYDGQMTCGQLLKHGNFGIGTFDKLDGEMLIHQGKIYQIKADGNVYRPIENTKTPFATVCNFKPDTEFDIAKTDYETLKSIIDKKLPNQNLFVAIEITGKFSYIKTRSVPAQKKPYPPLAEVTKNQPIFQAKDINGTIVGFRCPAFVKGINVPQYHLHFVSDDTKFGGHILSFNLTAAKCKADVCNEFLLLLPKDDSLVDVDLSIDKSEELKSVKQ